MLIRRYRSSVAGAALSQKLVRTLLWELIADDHLLFQAAIFVAGTHCNTCGAPSASIQLGPALAVLRGASLRALRETVQHAENSSFKTTAIALLAGWERKFGDRDSYSTHMSVWRALPLPRHALNEGYVLTLLDFTFEAFREGLDEQAGLNHSVLAPWTIFHQAETAPTLRGFARVSKTWPESRSLLAIAFRISIFDPYDLESIPTIRKLCIDGIAWSPSHTKGIVPLAAYEDSRHDLPLSTLYHIRAACISLNGILLRIASDHHGIPCLADIEDALFAHSVSCRRLPTKILMGTEFQNIALWSRFFVCVAARDTGSDDLLRELMAGSKINSFGQLEQLFDEIMYHRNILRDRCWTMYSSLVAADGS